MKTISLFLFLLSSSALLAQDRQMARVYQSATLPKGRVDLELWNTYRFGKPDYFSRLDQRLEFETGLTDKLQTAFYINASHHSFSIPGDTSYTVYRESEFSFSTEWKRKFTDPTAHAIGSALYGELTLSSGEIEIEPQVILDKNFGKNIVSFNATAEIEYEWENEKPGMELELEATPAIFSLGYMHMFRPSFGFGLEAVNHYEIVTGKGVEHAAILAGPTLYYSSGKSFLILNFLPQLSNLNQSKVPGRLDLDEYERYNIRLFFGLGL